METESGLELPTFWSWGKLFKLKMLSLSEGVLSQSLQLEGAQQYALSHHWW